MRFWKKPFVYAAVYTAALLCFTAYVLLDTFVIARPGSPVKADHSFPPEITDGSGVSEETAGETTAAQYTQATASGGGVQFSDTSYADGNITISIEKIKNNDTYIYIADVEVKSAEYLRTLLARDTFGTNITETTSDMSERAGAILAINGDYYGANKRGYVIKNGVLYRDTIRGDTAYDDLVVYADGSFGFVNEKEVSAQQLIADGVRQLFAFGPVLVRDGEIAVDSNDEVGKSMSSNPRTALGVINALHYVFVVSDGRTAESEGLSLYELAEVMAGYGCTAAYNLDGGGSSTMVFNGRLINNPTTNGRTITERKVSDIVYIGY